MSKRLDAIISLIDSRVGVADVGTDHGYIPINLALSGYKGNLLASDINDMPLKSAISFAQNAGVEERITFRLCDGLEMCSKNEVDTVVIAGLGGDIITSIIDKAPWTHSETCSLILQPMTKSEILRYWLISNGFNIETEIILKEAGRIFKIIKARFCGRNAIISDAELFTGKYDMIKDQLFFTEMLEEEILKIKKTTDGMKSAALQNSRHGLYERILDQLIEMRNKNEQSI